MKTLLLILLVLFAALALVVKLTEKYGSPLQPEQQAKLWRILIVLVFAGLIIRLIQFAIEG